MFVTLISIKVRTAAFTSQPPLGYGLPPLLQVMANLLSGVELSLFLPKSQVHNGTHPGHRGLPRHQTQHRPQFSFKALLSPSRPMQVSSLGSTFCSHTSSLPTHDRLPDPQHLALRCPLVIRRPVLKWPPACPGLLFPPAQPTQAPMPGPEARSTFTSTSIQHSEAGPGTQCVGPSAKWTCGSFC